MVQTILNAMGSFTVHLVPNWTGLDLVPFSPTKIMCFLIQYNPIQSILRPNSDIDTSPHDECYLSRGSFTLVRIPQWTVAFVLTDRNCSIAVLTQSTAENADCCI